MPAATNLPNQATVNTLFTGYGATAPVSNTLNLGFNDDGTLFTQTGARNYKGPTTDGYAIIAGNVRMPVGPQIRHPEPAGSQIRIHEVRLRGDAGAQRIRPGPVRRLGCFHEQRWQPHAVRNADDDPGHQSVHSERSAHAARFAAESERAFHVERALRRSSLQSMGRAIHHRAISRRPAAASCRSRTGRGTSSPPTTPRIICSRTRTRC